MCVCLYMCIYVNILMSVLLKNRMQKEAIEKSVCVKDKQEKQKEAYQVTFLVSIYF